MHSFPMLPKADVNHPWSAAVHKAYHIMSDTHSHILRVLRQEDPDPVRLNQHTSTIIYDTLPILEALETEALESRSEHCLPTEWLESCAVALGHLLVETMSGAETASGKCVIRSESPMTVDHC
jgi:hypothetical protein